MAKLIFRNVGVWNSASIQEGVDVVVEDRKIQSISPHKAETAYASDFKIYNDPDKVLIPLGVDLQVHLRVPGQSHKETADTGLKAARKGAYGAILNMPNTKPVIDNAEVLIEARKSVEAWEKLWGVEVLWSAAMTLGQLGEKLVDVAALKKAGAVALTDDGVGVAKDEVMEQVFAAGAKYDLPVLQHAEVPGHGAALAAGPTQASLGLKPYPEEAEWKMVQRDLKLLEKHPKARYHVLHVSSAKTLELIQAAQKKGLYATGEATPHHLFFTSSDIPKGNTNYKMNPPLRSAADRAALRQGLRDGSIAFVSTDHAPHESQLKGNDFNASAFGTTGLETSLRVLLTLFQKNDLAAGRLVQVFSEAPAQFIGLDKKGYGSLRVGGPFRAVLVDPWAKPTEITNSDLASLSHNNCFLGSKLAGELFESFV